MSIQWDAAGTVATPGNNNFVYWDDGLPFAAVNDNNDLVFWDDGLVYGGED